MNTIIQYFGIGKFGRPLQTLCPTCKVRYGRCKSPSGKFLYMEHTTRLWPRKDRRALLSGKKTLHEIIGKYR